MQTQYKERTEFVWLDRPDEYAIAASIFTGDAKRAPVFGHVESYSAPKISENDLDVAVSYATEDYHGIREDIRRGIQSWADDRARDATIHAVFAAIRRAAIAAGLQPHRWVVEHELSGLAVSRRKAIRDSGRPAWCSEEVDLSGLHGQAYEAGRFVTAIARIKEHIHISDEELAGHPCTKNGAADDAKGLILIDKIVEFVHARSHVTERELPMTEIFRPMSSPIMVKAHTGHLPMDANTGQEIAK